MIVQEGIVQDLMMQEGMSARGYECKKNGQVLRCARSIGLAQVWEVLTSRSCVVAGRLYR